MKFLSGGKQITLLLRVAFIAIGILFPITATAETYFPIGTRNYQCSRTGVSGTNLVGQITIRSKTKGKLIAGRKSWSYSAVVTTLNSLAKSKSKKDKTKSRDLQKAMNYLLTCYDKKGLRRPTFAGATPTPAPTVIVPNEFSEVSAILQSNCKSCHQNWVLTEEYFIGAGYVRAQSPSQSSLYRSLRQNPEGFLPASMPASGSALTSQQISKIRSWIENIGVTTPTPTPSVVPPTPTSPTGSTPTPTPTPSAPVAFDTVSSILNNNCMGCHTARGWILSEDYFLGANLVTAGQPTQSQLYRYLRDNPEGLTPASMPLTGAALTSEQIGLIRQWIAGITATTPPPPVGEFACLPSIQVAPSRMKRLSREQLKNSLVDLVKIGLGNTWVPDYYVWQSSGDKWAALPLDYSRLGHDRLDDRIDEYYLETLFSIIENIANSIQRDGRMAQFVQNYVPSCNASNYLTPSCRDQFLMKFGRRALKSPLTNADRDFYRRPDQNGVSQATYPELIIQLLSSPGFLYHLEKNGTPVDSTNLLVRISPHEYVSRLAYTLWNTTPDEQLLQYADNGTVDQSPETVVDYVLNQQQEKSRLGLRDFFKGWFQINHLLNDIAQYFEVDGIIPRLLAVNYGTSDPALIPDTSDAGAVRTLLLNYRRAAEDEIYDIGSILTFVQPSPVGDLFRTQLAPVQDITLSRNYNLAQPWNGDMQSIPLTSEYRKGIFTRTAFHLTRGYRSRPILWGALLRTSLLCDSTGLPANNSAPDSAQVNSDAYRTGSTHFQVQSLTEQSGTACRGCHQSWINPLGMGLSDFDTLGRRRNGMEWIFAASSSSPETEYMRAYSSVVTPRADRANETSVSGTVQLGEQFAQSDAMHACFTRNLVRFALNRAENVAGDGCFMNDLFTNAKTLPMKEVLRRFFLSPAYRLRRLNEAN